MRAREAERRKRGPSLALPTTSATRYSGESHRAAVPSGFPHQRTPRRHHHLGRARRSRRGPRGPPVLSARMDPARLSGDPTHSVSIRPRRYLRAHTTRAQPPIETRTGALLNALLLPFPAATERASSIRTSRESERDEDRQPIGAPRTGTYDPLDTRRLSQWPSSPRLKINSGGGNSSLVPIGPPSLVLHPLSTEELPLATLKYTRETGFGKKKRNDERKKTLQLQHPRRRPTSHSPNGHRRDDNTDRREPSADLTSVVSRTRLWSVLLLTLFCYLFYLRSADREFRGGVKLGSSCEFDLDLSWIFGVSSMVLISDFELLF